MQDNKARKTTRSKTKITPPKKKAESLSRDEVRSINKRKIRRKRKAKRIAILVFMALAVVCAGIALILAVFFRINTVQVKGSATYTKKQIVSSGGVETGSNLFMVNDEKVNEKLTNSLPYIESVTIERKLPDTLIINVTETKTAGSVQNGKTYVYVDKSGKVLSTGEQKYAKGSAIVRGVTIKTAQPGSEIVLSKEEINSDFLGILSSIDESKIENITAVNYNEKSGFTLVYDRRITIEFGSMTNLTRKLQRAAAAIEQENEINPNGVGTLDLSVEPNAYFDAGVQSDGTNKDKKNAK